MASLQEMRGTGRQTVPTKEVMPFPVPTPIYRICHIDNLSLLVARGGMHAANNTPNDGRVYKTIHNVAVQAGRSVRQVPCGPGGVIHDYVPFYFGVKSVMMLQLKTGYVPGYMEGQKPLIYLVAHAQAVAALQPFVFTDGHGLAHLTSWFDNLDQLDQVPWNIVHQQYWRDTVAEPDRQRRKQAEFLVHAHCPWQQIAEIGVFDSEMKLRVEQVLAGAGSSGQVPVNVHRDWYYP